MTTGKVFQAITLFIALCTAVIANSEMLRGVVPEKMFSVILFVTTVLASALPSLLMNLSPAAKSSRYLKGATTTNVAGNQTQADQIVNQNYPRGPMTGMIVLLALLIAGCTGSFEEAKLAGLRTRTAATPPPTARCQSLDSGHRTWGALGKGAAVLAGASGVATWPAPNDNAKIALAVSSGVIAAAAATAIYVSEDYSSTWARECSQ